MSFAVHVEPHGEWRTELDVGTWFGVLSEAMGPWDVERDRRRPSMARGLEKWVGAAPRLECDWDPLEATYRRSLVDLAAPASLQNLLVPKENEGKASLEPAKHPGSQTSGGVQKGTPSSQRDIPTAGH